MNTGGSSQQDPTALEEWVVVSTQNLQRSLRRTRLALTLLALFVLAWMVTPPVARMVGGRAGLATSNAPKEVRAGRFVLTDAAGHVRGTWGVDESGGARLLLRDTAGIARVRISVLATGSPGMAFTDELGRSRVALGLLSDRSTSLVFADPNGATRVVLGFQPENGATLAFADSSGQTRAGIGVETDGEPTFLMDQDSIQHDTKSGG